MDGHQAMGPGNREPSEGVYVCVLHFFSKPIFFFYY